MTAPLFVNSSYSFYFGTMRPREIAARAAEAGYKAIALTDRNGVYGLPVFCEACAEFGLKAILGTELLFERPAPAGAPASSGGAAASSAAARGMAVPVPPELSRALLIAEDEEGFACISRLLSSRAGEFGQRVCMRLSGGIDIITDDMALLAAFARGAAPDPPAMHAQAPARGAAIDMAAFRACGFPPVYALLSPANRPRWRSLKASGFPSLATGEFCFGNPADREIQRLLIAIGTNRNEEEVEERELAPAGALFMAPGEFEKLYAGEPDALAANEELVGRISKTGLFHGFFFPEYRPHENSGAALSPVCGAVSTAATAAAGAGSAASRGAAGAIAASTAAIAAPDSTAQLRALVYEGARRRYGFDPGAAPGSGGSAGAITPEAVRARIERELSIIRAKGFSSYFLVVHEIARRASRTCGRGSAAASIVSYCLGLTDVEPIGHNLYFERFLNPGRKDPPDIDIDFAWDERDALLSSVIEQYGKAHAARVSNHICFEQLSAVRETARASGMPDGEIGAFERSLIMDSGAAIASADPAWRDIVRKAQRIIGFPRFLGVHSGGLIIVPDELANHVPIETTGAGVRVTVWDKDGVEAAGLVKIDLLGNRSLAVVRDALANIKENGRPIDEYSWRPLEDKATEDILARGDSMGVFYVESPAMRLLQQKTRRGDFEHLVIHSSIIRPAANRYISEYIDRLNGKPYRPLHPLLAGLFDESYGIMCYQEDVCKAAIALSGFSAAEADGVRKALTRRDASLKLEAYREKFFAGARAKGVADSDIEAVWKMIESFSGYSFVKAHSASYAMLSFKSAYLRRHFPAEFMAAVMSNHGGFYSTLAYASEARRMGLELLPPDVNRSAARCRGKDKAIRFGLEMIKALSGAFVDRLIAERTRGSSFASLDDFARRLRPGRAEAEALVGSGAVDSLAGGLPRPAQLMQLFAYSSALEAEARCGPDSAELFDSLPSAPLPVTPAPRIRQGFADSKQGRLEAEMRCLGTTLETHPLFLYPGLLSRPRSRGCDLPRLVGQRVSLLGWPITSKPTITAKDEPMEFVSFEDETALYETVLFPKVYIRCRRFLYEERPLFVRGLVQNDRGAIVLTVEDIFPA